MTRLAFALAALTACATGAAVPDHAAPPAFADAQATAIAQHRALVVEFGAPWCAPCRAFAADVLTDPRVAAALRDVMFVQYDLETSVGKTAAEHCQVAAVPVVLRVDADGVLHPMATVAAGSEPTAEQFIAFVEEATRIARAARP